MKKAAIVLLIAVAMLTFSACTGNVKTERLLGLKWPDNGVETATYLVRNQNNETGEFTETLQKLNGTKSVSVGGLTFENATGHLQTSKLIFGDDVIEQAILFSSTGTEQIFAPVASWRYSKIDGVESTEAIAYDELTAKYVVLDGRALPDADALNDTQKLTRPYYDNRQIYTVVRTADLSTKFSFSFKIFLPSKDAADSEIVTLDCTYSTKSDESLTLNGETANYSSYRISIARDQSISGNPLYAWYAVNDITVDGYIVQNMLIKFTENDYTYTLTGLTVSPA